MSQVDDIVQDLDDNTRKALLERLVGNLDENAKSSLLSNLAPVSRDSKKAEINEEATNEDRQVKTENYDDRKLPSLSKFSGNNAKGEPTYKRWKFEVLELQQAGCPDVKLCRAIRKSLFGMASDAYMYLGETPSVQNILDKFDILFKTTDDDETAMAQFYSAKQHKDESLPTWFTRLECMLNADCLSFSQEQKEKMLRSRFWKGLACETLKNALRHKYDTGSTTMQLLQAARQIKEEAPALASQCSIINTRSIDKPPDEAVGLSKLMEQLSTLQTRLDRFEGQLNQNNTSANRKPSSQSFHGTCFKCKRFGHKASDCRSKLNFKAPMSGGHAAYHGNPPHAKQH